MKMPILTILEKTRCAIYRQSTKDRSVSHQSNSSIILKNIGVAVLQKFHLNLLAGRELSD